jgi:hypothetical protein
LSFERYDPGGYFSFDALKELDGDPGAHDFGFVEVDLSDFSTQKKRVMVMGWFLLRGEWQRRHPKQKDSGE